MRPRINRKDGTVIPATFIPASRCTRATDRRYRKDERVLLWPSDIPVIRACIACKEPWPSIAKRYGVSRSAIAGIAYGLSWKGVT